MAVVRPNTRNVRHRSFKRLRYSDRMLAFVRQQATRLGYLPEYIWGTLMDRGMTADQVAGLVNNGPTVSVAPAITGTATVGQTLTVTNGTWVGTGITYTRQWLLDGRPIAGATNTTLVIPANAAGKRISAYVQATNSNGFRIGYANTTGVIAAA